MLHKHIHLFIGHLPQTVYTHTTVFTEYYTVSGKIHYHAIEVKFHIHIITILD